MSRLSWCVVFSLTLCTLGVRGGAQPSSAQPPAIEGSWRGALGALHLLVSIVATPDGGRRGVLDSIDQHTQLPIDVIAISNGKLHFEIAAIAGVYDGALAADGKKLVGTWTQRGVPAQPLSFERASEAVSVLPIAKRPASPFGPPVEIVIPRAPTAVLAHGHRTLAYELHITNFGGAELSLSAIELQDGGGAKLARVEGALLGLQVRRVGQPDAAGTGQLAIAAGGRAIVFVWVALAGSALPARLVQRVEIRDTDGEMRPVVLPPMPLLDTALRIGPPLRGRDWRAANGPADLSTHRRSLIPVGGRAYIAQRYAIDWVRAGAEGLTYKGDRTKNASYLAYGAEALAVANGVIVEVKDGLPENPVGGAAQALTLQNVAGNHVLLDLGHGRRALYAHFQAGSIKVKVGDKVKRGQVLGLVGNTGNSSEPHLHFHIAEGESPLAAEGIPYVIDHFESRADATKQPESRTNELPSKDDLVDFK